MPTAASYNNRDRKLKAESSKIIGMYYSEYREWNYGAKFVKYRVGVQQYEDSTTVKDMKTKTQKKTINSLDYDAIGSMEMHITMNGINCSVSVTIRLTNRCDFLYYVFISFFSSFPYMFWAFMSPSSGVFLTVVDMYMS